MCVQGHFLASFLLAVPFCLAASAAPAFSDANWMSLGGVPGPNGPVHAAVVDSSGHLYIGGNFTSVGEVPARNIAKWNGTSWSALGSGMDSRVLALAVLGNDLYAGGSFTTAGGSPANYIARWDGSGWSPLGSGMWRESHQGLYPAFVSALAVSGGDLYAGGWFSKAGGSNANATAKWDGSSWSPLGSGMGFGIVYALAVSGANLYAGGSFTTADGSPATNIAKWDGSSWSALGSGVGNFTNGVGALALLGSDLYAGGDFFTAGGSPANRIAKWNGSTWSALGAGIGGVNSGVRALTVSGADLYAGGSFTTAGEMPAANIAKWNGSALSALGLGVNSNVLVLTAAGSVLYVGGQFTTAGSQVSAYIAKARIGSSAESITASGSSSTIQFTGVVGYEYHVQRTDTLTPPMTWTTLTTTPLSPATDGSLTFTDTTAPPGTAYYRLVQN